MDAPTTIEIRAWSDVEFAELGYGEPAGSDPDRMEILIARAVAEAFGWGIDLSALDPDSTNRRTAMAAVIAAELIQRLVEYNAAKGQQGILETAADFDMISNLSVDVYSETRRGTRTTVEFHPWLLVNRLVETIFGLQDPSGRPSHTPAVQAPDVDWQFARYIIDAKRVQFDLGPFDSWPDLPGVMFSP